jgi:hypothetical protein
MDNGELSGCVVRQLAWFMPSLIKTDKLRVTREALSAEE